MADDKEPLELDEMEASLALHALRFYMNAKGFEISSNTRRLEAKLDGYLSDTTFRVIQVESVASILGARGGTKSGASTSDAKKAAAVKGARGGRPPKPNLFIKFSKSVWQEPDPELLNALNKLTVTTGWLPDESDDEIEGPYVRMHVAEVTKRLEKLLSNSPNVVDWDLMGLYHFCAEHAVEKCVPMIEGERHNLVCITCGRPAILIY